MQGNSDIPEALVLHWRTDEGEEGTDRIITDNENQHSGNGIVNQEILVPATTGNRSIELRLVDMKYGEVLDVIHHSFIVRGNRGFLGRASVIFFQKKKAWF